MLGIDTRTKLLCPVLGVPFPVFSCFCRWIRLSLGLSTGYDGLDAAAPLAYALCISHPIFIWQTLRIQLLIRHGYR